MLIDKLLIGAGAMKSGTTWAYAVLSKHPEIYFSYEKEIHYFYAAHVDPGMLSATQRMELVQSRHLASDRMPVSPQSMRDKLRWCANYLDGPVDDHWYQTLFVHRRPGSWAADFSNLYALLPTAVWARMARQTGQIAVLYTLRHPAEWLWSHTKFHLAHTGQSHLLRRWDLSEILDFARQPFIADHADYPAAIARMHEGLPPDALHVTWHDTLQAHPARYLDGIHTHIGVGPHDYPPDLLDRTVNPSHPDPMPEGFEASLQCFTDRVVAKLTALGYRPPERWHAPIDAALSA